MSDSERAMVDAFVGRMCAFCGSDVDILGCVSQICPNKAGGGVSIGERGTVAKFREALAALPVDSAARKNIPLARGCLDYFPAALAAIAEVSKKGNDKHNPGEEMHHSRGKSNDHADCILRHLTDRGTIDSDDGLRHTAKMAWRALALLQEELEAAGAPLARGAKK